MQGVWQKIGATWVAIIIAIGILGTAALLTYQTTITSAHPADALPSNETVLYIQNPTTQLLDIFSTLYPTIAITDTTIPENTVAIFYVKTPNGIEQGYIVPSKAELSTARTTLPALEARGFNYYLSSKGILSENQVAPLSLSATFKTLTETRMTSGSFAYIGSDVIKVSAPQTLVSLKGATITIDSIAKATDAIATPPTTVRLLPNGRIIHSSNLRSLVEIWRQKTPADQETIQMALFQNWWSNQVHNQVSVAYEVLPNLTKEVSVEYSTNQSGTTLVVLHGKRTDAIDALLERITTPSSTYSTVTIKRDLGDFTQQNIRLDEAQTTQVSTEQVGDWELQRIPKGATELIIGRTNDRWLLTNQPYGDLTQHLEANELFSTIEPSSIVPAQLIAHGSSQSFLPLEQTPALQIQNWSVQQLNSIRRIRLELLKQAL